jgi:hypothetical protein
VNNELKRMWKETVVALYLNGGTKKNHENMSGWPVSGFQPRVSGCHEWSLVIRALRQCARI